MEQDIRIPIPGRTYPKNRFRAERRNFGARGESEDEEYPRYFESKTKPRSPKLGLAEPEWIFRIGSSTFVVYGKLRGPLRKMLIVFVHDLSGHMNEGKVYNGALFFDRHGYSSFRFNLYD